MEKVKLSKLVDAFNFLTDGTSAYLDTKIGEVVWLPDEFCDSEFDDDVNEDEDLDAAAPSAEWDDRQLAKAIDADQENRFFSLPDRYGIDEPDIVREYIANVGDAAIGEDLAEAFHGRGAFRRFKDALARHDMEDDWYAYRNRALKRAAVDWCRRNEVPWVDDLAPAVNKEKSAAAGKKRKVYAELLQSVRGLLEGERDPVANAANLAAALVQTLTKVSWAGFYFLRGEELVLGPFQGKPACTRIPMGKGVCGHAARRRETAVVPDVHEFPGHIACDPDSRSEIVVPLLKDDRLVGVLDLDSTFRNRFDSTDRRGLESIAAAYVAASDFTQ